MDSSLPPHVIEDINQIKKVIASYRSYLVSWKWSNGIITIMVLIDDYMYFMPMITKIEYLGYQIQYWKSHGDGRLFVVEIYDKMSSL